SRRDTDLRACPRDNKTSTSYWRGVRPSRSASGSSAERAAAPNAKIDEIGVLPLDSGARGVSRKASLTGVLLDETISCATEVTGHGKPAFPSSTRRTVAMNTSGGADLSI